MKWGCAVDSKPVGGDHHWLWWMGMGIPPSLYTHGASVGLGRAEQGLLGTALTLTSSAKTETFAVMRALLSISTTESSSSLMQMSLSCVAWSSGRFLSWSSLSGCWREKIFKFGVVDMEEKCVGHRKLKLLVGVLFRGWACI